MQSVLWSRENINKKRCMNTQKKRITTKSPKIKVMKDLSMAPPLIILISEEAKLNA